MQRGLTRGRVWRAIREAAGLTQTEAAMKVPADQKVISRGELGEFSEAMEDRLIDIYGGIEFITLLQDGLEYLKQIILLRRQYQPLCPA